MNTSQNNSSPISWGKIAIVIAVVAIVAVVSGRAGLEDLFNLDPGTLGGPAVAEKADSDGSDSDNRSSSSNDKTGQGTSARPNNRNPSDTRPRDPKDTRKEFKFERKGYVLESPEGLTYYVGDRSENRIDHVMRHANDIPDRGGSHGVFHGDKNEIFRTIDEAYALIKSNSTQVVSEEKEPEKQKVTYEVDMQRVIGFKGGQSGRRTRNPELTTLKLVLRKGNRVITAYPY